MRLASEEAEVVPIGELSQSRQKGKQKLTASECRMMSQFLAVWAKRPHPAVSRAQTEALRPMPASASQQHDPKKSGKYPAMKRPLPANTCEESAWYIKRRCERLTAHSVPRLQRRIPPKTSETRRALLNKFGIQKSPGWIHRLLPCQNRPVCHMQRR